MTNAIRITYWNFKARLSEWIDHSAITEFENEIFALFTAGYEVHEVAPYIGQRLIQERKRRR